MAREVIVLAWLRQSLKGGVSTEWRGACSGPQVWTGYRLHAHS